MGSLLFRVRGSDLILWVILHNWRVSAREPHISGWRERHEATGVIQRRQNEAPESGPES